DTGQLEFITKCNHIWCDNAKVFGNERQVAQLCLDGFEESSAGPGDPMSGFSGLSRCGNVPGGAKCTEVVEPNQVHVGQQRLEAMNAPAITGAVKGFPIIYWVSPELSFGTEIIRRHTSHELRPEVRVKLEPLGIGPNIAGI